MISLKLVAAAVCDRRGSFQDEPTICGEMGRYTEPADAPKGFADRAAAEFRSRGWTIGETCLCPECTKEARP